MMRKSASELQLEAFIRDDDAAEESAWPPMMKPTARGHEEDNGRPASSSGGAGTPGGLGAFDGDSVTVSGAPPLMVGASRLQVHGRVLEHSTEDGSTGGGQLWWSESVRAPWRGVSAATESRTASFSASPRAATSGKHAPDSESDSDSESLVEVDGAPCERGTKSVETKRIRRMVSNRESARRSRRKKQAQLSDIESQVEQLKVENASLLKQLAEVDQQFTTAVTDNRILKSDVEALRVKVKMAEDMVARTAMSCGQGHLGLAPFLNSRKMCQALGMLSGTGMDLPLDDACFKGLAPARQVQNSPVQNTASIESMDNRMSSEMTSCAADRWP